MLPACRTEGKTETCPPFALARSDVEGFLHELRNFHDAFRSCFPRRESREHLFRYMVGLLSPLERKSIEPMALEVEGGNVRAMQRFVSDDCWDEARMRHIYHQLVYEDMGAPAGVVIVDESGFQKKGKDSVGVARQYCGTLGKVENCQVGVFAAYASPHGYALVDQQLFLPEPWFTEVYAERRTKCQVPKNLAFQTKPQLAGTMVSALFQERVLPFKYVVADCLYGNSADFLAAVEACWGVTYLVATPADTRCWLHGPVMETHAYRYRGKARTKRVVRPADGHPPTVEMIAKRLPETFWYRRTVSEGTQGPIVYEFTKRQVTLCREGMPDRAVWLVLKRTVGAEPSYWYYISNAPLSTRLPTFVWLSSVRWAIEQSFEEAKTELGMDHYEVRKHPGWYHHMLLCMLAHFFLWHVKIRLGEKSTGLDPLPDADVSGSGPPLTPVYDC
jgi:SRSO17 transposase